MSIPHTILYPCYVESYVVSALVSFDIFFTEIGSDGEGFKLYEALINREVTGLSFSERLEAVGIDSPFAEGKIKNIANRIYAYMAGKDFVFDEDKVPEA